MEENLNWLNCWEEQVENGKISKDEYLTQNTADGLRVTIKSMLELSKYLLEKYGFKYVLTYNMNQDRLELFSFYKFVDDINFCLKLYLYKF